VSLCLSKARNTVRIYSVHQQQDISAQGVGKSSFALETVGSFSPLYFHLKLNSSNILESNKNLLLGLENGTHLPFFEHQVCCLCSYLPCASLGVWSMLLGLFLESTSLTIILSSPRYLRYWTSEILRLPRLHPWSRPPKQQILRPMYLPQ